MKKSPLAVCAPKIYGSAAVGVKGQVVIPVKLRKDLGIKTDDNLVFMSKSPDGPIIVVKLEMALAMRSMVDDVRGALDALSKKSRKKK